MAHRGHILAAAILAFALTASAPAAAATFEAEDGSAGAIIEAHARTYSLFAFAPESDALPYSDTAFVIERLRPVFEGWISDSLELRASWDVLPIIGQQFGQATGFAVQPTGSLRLVDFDRELYDSDSGTWQVLHNLDRLHLAYYTPFVEVRVGRQAIGHGSARMLPAADLFAPFGPATIDTQFRRGVDALRVTAPIGEAHEAELYVVAEGDDVERWMYMARWRSSFVEVLDLSVLVGMSYERPTLALDLSGDLFGAGWYVEGSARYDLDEDDLTARATAGLDYQWAFGLRTLVELHYNGVGGEAPYTDLLIDQPLEYRVGEAYLFGEFYLGASASWSPEATPLLAMSLGYIQNLTDGSMLLNGALMWDFSERVSLGAGAIAPLGERMGVSDLGFPELSSEFGAYPVVAFTDMRLLF